MVYATVAMVLWKLFKNDEVNFTYQCKRWQNLRVQRDRLLILYL